MAIKATAKATAAPLALVLNFDYEKETPGTLRYKEVERANSARAFIGTLYLTKEGVALLGGNTTKLTVTIEAAG
jgi:hypothetical protein